MNIGQVIKELRNKRKVSQQKLSKLLGITQGYLSLIEKGEREPGMGLIQKIAHSFGIPQQLIFLLASGPQPGMEKFSKPLKKIALAIDDILRTAKIC